MDVTSKPLQKGIICSLSLPEKNCKSSSSFLPTRAACSLQLVVYPFTSSSSSSSVSSSSQPNGDGSLSRQQPTTMQGKKSLQENSTRLCLLAPSPADPSRRDTSSKEMLSSTRKHVKSLSQASSRSTPQNGDTSQIPSETEGRLPQDANPSLHVDISSSSTSLVPVASSSPPPASSSPPASSPPPASSSPPPVLLSPCGSSLHVFPPSSPSSPPPPCSSPPPRAGVIHESSFPIFFPSFPLSTASPHCSSSLSPSPSPPSERFKSPSYFFRASSSSFPRDTSCTFSSSSSSSPAIFLPVQYAFTTTTTTAAVAHPGAFSLPSRGVRTPLQDYAAYRQQAHPSYHLDETERSSRCHSYCEHETRGQEELRIQDEEEEEEEEDSLQSCSSLLALQASSQEKSSHAPSSSQRGRRSDGFLSRVEEEDKEKREEMEGEHKQLQGSIEIEEEEEICFSQDEEREGHTCTRERQDPTPTERRRRRAASSSSSSDDVDEKEEVDASLGEEADVEETKKKEEGKRGILKRRSLPVIEEGEGRSIDERRASLLHGGRDCRHSDKADGELLARRGRARTRDDKEEEEEEEEEREHPCSSQRRTSQGDLRPRCNSRRRARGSEKLQRNEEEEEEERISPSTHPSTRGVRSSLSSSLSSSSPVFSGEEECLSREGWESIHHRYPHVRVNPSKHLSSCSQSSSSREKIRESPPHSPRALLDYLRRQGCYESSFSLQRNPPFSPSARHPREASVSRRRGCMYTPRSRGRYTSSSTRLLTPAEVSAQLLLQHSQRREEDEPREEQGENTPSKKKNKAFQKFSLHGRPVSFSSSSSSLPSRFLELSKRSSLPCSFRIHQRNSHRDLHKQRRDEEDEDDVLRCYEEGEDKEEGEEEDGRFLPTIHPAIESSHSFSPHSSFSPCSPLPRRLISSSPAFARLLSRASSGSTSQRRRRHRAEAKEDERDRRDREGAGKAVMESPFSTTAASTRRQSTRHHRSSSSSSRFSSASPVVESRRQREKQTPGKPREREEREEEEEREGRSEAGGPFSGFWNLFNSRSIDKDGVSTTGKEGVKKKKKEQEENKKMKEEEKSSRVHKTREKTTRRKNEVDAWGCDLENPLAPKEKDRLLGDRRLLLSQASSSPPLPGSSLSSSSSAAAANFSSSPHLSTSKSFILKMPSDPSVLSGEKSSLEQAASLPRVSISDSNEDEDETPTQPHFTSSSSSPSSSPPLPLSAVTFLPSSSKERPSYQENPASPGSYPPSRSRNLESSSHGDDEVYVHPTPICPPSPLPAFSPSSSQHRLPHTRNQENSIELDKSQDSLSYEQQEMKKTERRMKRDLSFNSQSDRSSRRLQSVATCPSTTLPEDTGEEGEDEEDDVEENSCFDAEESTRHETSFFHGDTAKYSGARSTYIPVGSLEGRRRSASARRRRREKEEEGKGSRCRVASPRDFPPPTFERILFGLPDDDEEEEEEEEEEIGEKKEKKTSKQVKREKHLPGSMKDEGEEVGDEEEARGSKKKKKSCDDDNRPREGRGEDEGEKAKKILHSERKRKDDDEKEGRRRELENKRRSARQSMTGEEEERSARTLEQGKRRTGDREDRRKKKKSVKREEEEEEFCMGEEEKILSDFLGGTDWIETRDSPARRLSADEKKKKRLTTLSYQERVSSFTRFQGREEDGEEEEEEPPKRDRRREARLHFRDHESVPELSFPRDVFFSERDEGEEQAGGEEKKRDSPSDDQEESEEYEERSPHHRQPKSSVLIDSPSHLPYTSSSFFSPAPPSLASNTVVRRARKNEGKREEEKETKADDLHEEDEFVDSHEACEGEYEDRDEGKARGRRGEIQGEEELNLAELNKKERTFFRSEIHQSQQLRSSMSSSLSLSSSCFFDPSVEPPKDSRRERRRERQHRCSSSFPLSSHPRLPCEEERMAGGSSEECRKMNQITSREDRGRERRRREKNARMQSASRESCLSAKRRVKSPLKMMRQPIATTPPATPGVYTPGNQEDDISGVYTPSGKMRSLGEGGEEEKKKTLPHPPLYGRSSFSSLPAAASSTSCLKINSSSFSPFVSVREKGLSRRNRLSFPPNLGGTTPSPSSSALLSPSSSLFSSTASTLSLSSGSSSLSASSSSSSSLEEEGEERRRRQRQRRRERRRRGRERSRKEEERQRHLDTEELADMRLVQREERENLDYSCPVSSSSYSSCGRTRSRSSRHEQQGRKKGKKNLDRSTSPRNMIPSHSLYIPPLRLSSASFSSRPKISSSSSSSSSSSRLIDGSSLSCRYTTAPTARSAVPRGKFGGGSSAEEDEEGASSARRDRAYLSSLFALPFVSSPAARSKLQATVSRYALFKLCHDDEEEEEEEDKKTQQTKDEHEDKKEQPLLAAPPGKAKKKPLSLALLEQLEEHRTEQQAPSVSFPPALRMHDTSLSQREDEAKRLGEETKREAEGERKEEEDEDEEEKEKTTTSDQRKERLEDNTSQQSAPEEEVERGVEEEEYEEDEEERGDGEEEREDEAPQKKSSDRDDEALLLNSLRLLKESFERERKEKQRNSPCLSPDRPGREEDPSRKSFASEENSAFQKESFVSLDVFGYDSNGGDGEASVLDAKKRSFSTPHREEEEEKSERGEGEHEGAEDADVEALSDRQSISARAQEEEKALAKKGYERREKDRTGGEKEDVSAAKNDDGKTKEKERERTTAKKKKELKMLMKQTSDSRGSPLLERYAQDEEKNPTLSLLQRAHRVLSTTSSSSLPVSLMISRGNVEEERQQQQPPVSALDRSAATQDERDLFSSSSSSFSFSSSYTRAGDEAAKEERRPRGEEKRSEEREKEAKVTTTMRRSKTQDELMRASQIRDEIAKLKSLLLSCKQSASSSVSSPLDVSQASFNTHPCEDEGEIINGEEEERVKGEEEKQLQPSQQKSSFPGSLPQRSSLLLIRGNSIHLSSPSSSSSSCSYLANPSDRLSHSPSHEDEDNRMLRMKILSSSDEEGEISQGIPNAFDTLWKKSVQAHKKAPGGVRRQR